MNLLQNKNFAACAMVAMIIVGTLAGSHNSLMGIREEAAAVFVVGARGDGIGIQGDLRERYNAAYNLLGIARKYLPEENILIQSVFAARTAMDAAASVRGKAEADRALEAAVRDLYDVLSGMSLTEQDAGYRQRLYTDFRARGDTISHDPYNQRAVAFNRVLSGFPAGLLGSLTGVQALELFE